MAKIQARSNFVRLKRICLYIVSLVLVLYTTPLYQLCKIPVLISHYQEHHERDSAIGFLDFLSMHYWGTDIDDDDDDRDRQLPFKEFTGFSNTHLFAPVYRNLVIQQIAVDVQLNFPVEDHSLLPTPHITDLFHPPKA